MLELFLNTVTREWYDKDGNPFRDGMPRGAYQSREDVKITLCKETPNAGASGVDVSTWTRDDSLASVPGVGAMLTIDSDRIHKLKGKLSGEVSAGAVSTITATIENASNATVPESGTLRLFDDTGDYEAIAYTDRSIVDGEATFTVSGSVSGSYAVGSVIDCDQSPYAQAYLDTPVSNLEQGELVFYLVIDSQRLRSEMDYSDVATLSIAGLELLIYRTADGASDPVTAYLCETYSVTGTLGSVGNEAQPPDATADKLSGLVDQLLAAGLDVEQQYDSEGNTQFRVRSVSAGGTWSDWITVQKGEPGADGKNFSVDATGLMSERSQYDAEAAGFSFLATDEGNLYIKNSDSSGDWSDAISFQGPAGADGEPGPANTLTIGTVTTGEPGTQAAASITGESPNQVLNITVPRGDTGATGAQGAQGEKGDKGDPGPQGEQGPQGDPGDPNVAESMVDAKISTHNDDPAAHPDKLPLSGGTMTGELKINTSNALRIINGDYGAIFRSDGRSLYILVTDPGNQTGSYNTLRPFSLSLSTGKCSISGVVSTPRYNAGTDITSAAAQDGYTCTEGGWILASMAGSGETLKINGTTIGKSGHYFIPVSTGDAITLQHGATYYSSQITFYPY